MNEEAEIAAKYARCEEIKASDMSPLDKLLAWPFADDDTVVLRNSFGDITVGDLRALAALANQ